MCPRCKGTQVKRYMRIDAELDGQVLLNNGEAELTAVICSKCGYLIYDEKYGWAEDILATQDKVLQMAAAQDLNVDSSFLSSMGVPHCYQKGGVYGLHSGPSNVDGE